MKVLLGSNSYKSINKQVVDYIQKNANVNIEYIDLLQEDVVMYSLQEEETNGIPKYIESIYNEIQSTDDTILIATPEYNGFVSPFYKNIMDWLTRININVFQNKKVKVLCVTPGKMAGESVRGFLNSSLYHFGANEVYNFGIGNFYDIFQDGEIKDKQVNKELIEFIQQ